jgi:hypothetical protein
MFITNHTSPSEVISTMTDTTEFSPAIPWREFPDVQTRIQELRGYLDPKNPQYERKEQHTNIKAAIQLYEDGKIDGEEEVCIMEGKVVTKQEVFNGTAWAWVEVHSFKSFPKNLSNEWVRITGRVLSVC